MKGTIGAGYCGALLLAACLSAGGCADESDPAYLAGLLEDPIETEVAIEKLRKMVDQRLQIQDRKEMDAAMADFAARSTGPLVSAFKSAAGNPLVQGRILSILTRSVNHVRDPSSVLDGVFFPILDAFKTRGDDPAQVAMAVDTIAGMVADGTPAGTAMTEAHIEGAAARFRDVAKSIRDSWTCQERHIRMQGANNPVADQEQLMVSCIEGVAKLIGSPKGKVAQVPGVPLLVDSIRESFFFQDFFINRSAADAINEVAEKLSVEHVQQVAPALVEGLFLEGDFFLYPFARRALVHLAAAGPENREIVATELLRALNVDMSRSLAAALPAIDQVGKNENLELLALPCGARLSVSCARERDTLLEYLRQGWAPAKALCNKGADPDRPGSGFQWGFNYGVFWDKVGNILVDIVTPLQPGAAPDTGSKAGLTLEVMRRQIAETAAWIDNVLAAKALQERIAAAYKEFMDPPRAPAAAAQPAAAAPARPRPPTLSAGIKPLFEALKRLRDAGQAALGPEVRKAAEDLAAALALPDAKSGDKEACKDLLKGVFTDVQNELLTLADFDREYNEVNLRLWRTVAASRTLSLLGVTGPDDQVISDLLRITQFSLDNLMGFRITPLKAFPQLTLRFRQRFTAEGMPMMGQPAIPALIDAVQNFLRPTPEVLNFLLHMIAANALTGENRNATIREEKYLMINADVSTFRALATRAFFTVFRSDALPDAAEYLKLFEFYLGDVQYLLALEKTDQNEPAFRMYPPTAPPAPDAPPDPAEEPPADWRSVRPERSDLFGFDAYRDRLAACVLREREDRGDAAKWRRELNDEQKTRFCMKRVEPWKSQFAAQMRNVDAPELRVSDTRCWTHMRKMHDDRVQYCLDKEANRTPEKELNIPADECKKVKELDDTYYYCVDLRFLPDYLEARKPTLWGCYDQFPWLRQREPIGPACSHISQRLLAAYLYVKLRSDAGAPAADGVTYDALKAIMTIDEYLLFVRSFGAEQNEDLFRKVDRLSQELAKVKLDFPRFRRPRTEAERTSKANVRKPDDVKPPDFVSAPWYWRQGFTAREPAEFSDLRVSFLDMCRAEGDEAGAECARDGGRVGHQMKITIEGGTPGPLMNDAHSLAIMLMRQDLVGLGEMRDAVGAVERAAFAGGAYSAERLAEAALDGAGREQTLLVNAACRGMAVEALACVPDPEWDPGPTNEIEPCQKKKAEFAASVCARFFTDASQGRGITTAEMNRRVRALYLLAALAERNRDVAEAAVGDMLITVDADGRFMPPVNFAIQKIRPRCCPPGQPCDRLGCERVRLFSQYWRTQPMHENKAPDIDALYYMLVASR